MPVQRMLPRFELNQNSSRPQIQQILGTRAEDQGCSGLELTEVETGVIREVEETVSSKEGEPDMDVELEPVITNSSKAATSLHLSGTVGGKPPILCYELGNILKVK